MNDRWMQYTLKSRLILPALLVILTISFGCATKETDYGAEIRTELGVDENVPQATDGSIERYYDPNTILKRAEAFYGKGEYLEAIDEYKHFVSLHPLHKFADYAQFKLGMSHIKLSRTTDRDPEPFKNALQAFKKLLTDYPSTKYQTEATEKIKFCRESLASHELYVGSYYYSQNKYTAAIYRFKRITEEYGDTGVLDDAFYMMAISYRKIGDIALAEKSLRDLLSNNPDSRQKERAEKLLTSLNGKKDL
jgi:outer membrane protein assembly factor BamD